MPTSEIVGLESLYYIEHLDLTIGGTSGKEFPRGVKSQLKGHLSVDFECLHLNIHIRGEIFGHREHSDHVVFVGDCK